MSTFASDIGYAVSRHLRARVRVSARDGAGNTVTRRRAVRLTD